MALFFGSAAKVLRAFGAMSLLMPMRSSTPWKCMPAVPSPAYAIDFAFRSVCLKAATELISGFDVPARTATPTPARASSVRVAATSLPPFTSSSMTLDVDTATSKGARLSISVFTAGPPMNLIATLWPLERSNCGMSASKGGRIPPALSTVSSAAFTAKA
jgi:hypothetical protein